MDGAGGLDDGRNGMAAREQPATFHPDDDTQIDEFMGQDYNEEEEERRYYRRKRLATVRNLVCASLASMLIYAVYLGLLQMQLILHYDETYREVKYGNMGLQDIDRKMLMGINVTPVVALLYTPVLIRFLGTKWMMFLAIGIYALFVSTNYWERYYTLVPSAVAIGAAIVPLWASVGNYVTRMAQRYYEYQHYKEGHVQEQRKAPKGACHPYIIIFQSIFYFIFNLSFVGAELPTVIFLNQYLFPASHTLSNVRLCGSDVRGTIEGLNRTVLKKLPQSLSLIEVESVLMGTAFIAMLLVLTLCGPAYRPTEEIELRSVGWGNIFQLPFKHLRDYRLRLLLPFFVYSGFEVLFVCSGFALTYGVCSLGLESLPALIMVYGASASLSSLLGLSSLCLPRRFTLLSGSLVQGVLLLALFGWSPLPRDPRPANAAALYAVAALWGLGSGLNKSGLSDPLATSTPGRLFVSSLVKTDPKYRYRCSGFLPQSKDMRVCHLIGFALLGMLYEDKERQDFAFAVYHWCQAVAIFIVYLWSSTYMKVKLGIMFVTLVAAVISYLWMERKLSRNVRFRVPRIPRPRHKVKGYRYLEDENSDQSEEEEEGEGEGEMERDSLSDPHQPAGQHGATEAEERSQ